MHRRAAAVVLVLALVVPMAAVQAAEDGPHVPDGCGDADEMVRVGDEVVGTPNPERAAGFDVDHAWFEDIADGDGHAGVRVHLVLCGDVPEPELAGSNWSVRWDVDDVEEGYDACGRTVSVLDTVAPDSGSVVRHGRLSGSCSRPGTSVLGASVVGATVWVEVMDDALFSVDGNVITWTLQHGMLPAERAARIAFVSVGESWTGPTANARDGRWITEAVSAGARVTGPGASDWTADGRDFTVGACPEADGVSERPPWCDEESG